MNFDSFELHELLALNKSLSFVKYGCKDPDASFLAGSPIVSNILRMCCEKIWTLPTTSFRSSREFADNLRNGWSYVSVDDRFFSIALHHLKNIEQWNTMDISLKRQIATGYIAPYNIEQSVLDCLINRADEQLI